MIKTTTVGSYSQIDWLMQAGSEQAVLDATAVVINTQKNAGIDLPTDGELYRYDPDHPETNGMIEYFVRPMAGEELHQSLGNHLDVVLARHRQQVLAVEHGAYLGATQRGGDLLLDEFRLTFLDDQHGALAAAEIADLLGHQRVGDVEHQQRNLGGAKGIRQFELLQRPHQRIVQAALHDDADVFMAAGKGFVEAVFEDLAPRRRQALLEHELLVVEGRRRMRQARVVEARRIFHQRLARDRR